MSLRWRIAVGFALVALATAAVIALATPPIVRQGFSDFDNDNDVTAPFTAAATAAGQPDTEDSQPAPAPGPANNPGAEQATILRLIAAALLAAGVASLIGLVAAGRLTRPLTRLETAADGLAHGDLTLRSGLSARGDEFGQLGRTFDSMAGRLERAEESRRRFLQDAAHELKTPLAVIEATSSAIIDGVYPAERRHVETIRDQSRVLARIVDDLRTISLAEGGHLPLQKRPVDVGEMLRSVATAFGAKAATASVVLSVAANPGLVAAADPDRLRQIVGALVDNAIRYVKPGGHIRLLGQPAPASPGSGSASSSGRIRIVVEDDGPGFPPESVGRVFERFYQADTSRRRGTGTSGLGLSIVQAIAEAHGGSVGAENRTEGGAGSGSTCPRWTVARPRTPDRP